MVLRALLIFPLALYAQQADLLKPGGVTALARIDGVSYKLMDKGPQRVYPTRTVYEFNSGGVAIELIFFSPTMPQDLEVVGRPVTYVEFRVVSTSGPHQVEAYFDATTPAQSALWSRFKLGGQPVLRLGSRDQGYLYLFTDNGDQLTTAGLWQNDATAAFLKRGRLPTSDDFSDHHGYVIACAFDFGKVDAQPVSRYLMLAGDVESIEYRGRRLRPWWRRKDAEAADLLRAARTDFKAFRERAVAFDTELTADFGRAGDESYVRKAVLEYRKTLAAFRLVADDDGTPLYLPEDTPPTGPLRPDALLTRLFPDPAMRKKYAAPAR